MLPFEFLPEMKELRDRPLASHKEREVARKAAKNIHRLFKKEGIAP